MEDEPAWPARLIADRSLQRLDDGRVLVGGSPMTVLRLSVPVDVETVTAFALIDRLVDTGMAHPDPPAGPYTADDVTLVVPVHDDPGGLEETLRGCGRTLPSTTRVLVVDDASGDPGAIEQAVDVHGSGATELIRRVRNGGPAAARNTGWEHVRTPLVAFMDAGCVPGAGWLDALLPQFADPRVAVVAPRVRADPDRWTDEDPRSTASEAGWPDSPVGPTHPGPGNGTTDAATGGRVPFATRLGRRLRRTIARYEARRSSLDLGPEPGRIAPGTRVSYVPSACVVARTDILESSGGFDETLRVGEDVDLLWRLAADRRLRYVPAASVTHDVRTRPVSWLRRRFLYGTSAAPLALRHPGGPVPVRISPWSAAAWVAVAVGRPVTGLGIAGISVGLLVRKLGGVDDRARLAVSLAGRGNLAAGGLLANAVRRTWWPLAVPVALMGPRSLRRAVWAAFVIPPLAAWRREHGVDPLSWLLLCTADDIAYGAGVWAGCLRHRTVAPLLPDFSAGRFSRRR